MGVTQLWNILEPVKRQGDLASLKGKTLCVDLSGWICEAQGSKGLKANVLKPHLRNLFFRVWNLTRVGVKLVFVVDGDAPEVKWEAIVKRNQARSAYGGWGRGRGRGVAKGQRKKVGRSNFRVWVNECTTLLRLLGIPYVESAGEAEALCAWMDAKGIVDGCITNDGDAFLYGARTVYKDLCISNKECMMDYYHMDDIETKLCLNREKLVSLAILLGCDYLPQGVPGVGKEMGLKLVQALQGVNLLQRLQDWSSFKVCEDDMSKIEKTVKQKASKVAGFPSQAVINEFMCPKLKSQHLTVPKGYKCPDLKVLQEFCWNYLEWPEDYTTEKILPLVTYWQMETGLSVKHCNEGNIVVPERIVKARVQNRIECYEVLWKNNDIGDACQSTFVTIETRSLFGQVYPILVEDFEILQTEKKTKKSGKRKAKHNPEDAPNDNTNAVEELCSNFDTLSLAVESDCLGDPTSQTKLHDGKRTSEDEEKESRKNGQAGNPLLGSESIVRGSQDKQEGREQRLDEEDEQQHDTVREKYLQTNTLSPIKTNESKVPNVKKNLKCKENILGGSKEKQKRREPLQRHEEDDEQQRCAGAIYVQTNDLVPDVQNVKKNLKCKENLKAKVEKVEELLDSGTSSEDEMSDSFFCEFVAPLARRIQGHCPKDSNSDKIVNHNGGRVNTEIDIPGQVDSANIKDMKKANEVDGGIQVVLIESSEDEEEHDVCHARLKGQECLPHYLERPAFGAKSSSSKKYDTKTNQHLESDVEVTALGRAKFCTQIKHEKADGTWNGKEVGREPRLMLLGKEKVCSKVGYHGQMATEKMKDDVKNVMEMKAEPVNTDERSAPSLPSNNGLPGKGVSLSAVSLSREDRASATMVSSHSGKKSSNWKPKVMQSVYFSSDSSDDDDSWYIGSGKGGDGGVVADSDDIGHRGHGDDFWYVGGSVAAASRDGSNDDDGETKSIKNVKKSKKKEIKMAPSKTTETKISRLANDKIHLENLTPKHTEISGAKRRCEPQSLNKLHDTTASQLKTKQTPQVAKFHPSTHEQDYVYSSIEKNEKVSTPKSLEKTEEKENIESPLEDVFVPLSLSERLGRHLSGRRNVLSTLRTLSSN